MNDALHAVVAGRQFSLTSDGVVAAAAQQLPEPLRDHFCVVGGRRYPPKQVLALVTGLDRADFTTHQARRVLRRMGFFCGRRERPGDHAGRPDAGHLPHGGHEADALRPYIGQWVAQDGLDVLVVAETPEEVVAWLQRHDRAGAVFRVPTDPTRAGAAPA